jgi:hypothetical protein
MQFLSTLSLLSKLKSLLSGKEFLDCNIVGRDSDTLRAGRSGDQIPCGRDFPHPSSPVPWPGQRPAQWVHSLSPGGKVAGACVLHPPTFSAEVTEKWELYICCPFWTFTACSNVKYTLPLPIRLWHKILNYNVIWNSRLARPFRETGWILALVIRQLVPPKIRNLN